MALLFSIVSLGMSGYLVYNTYDDGRLVDNSRILLDEVTEAFEASTRNLHLSNTNRAQVSTTTLA